MASSGSGRGRGRRLLPVPGSPRALHSVVRRHPLPQPAPARSPPPPEASPAPSTPSPLFASSLLSTQPIVSQGTSRATCHTANWGGPQGGQSPGIGQLPAAPAPARLLFVSVAPISPGAHTETRNVASSSQAGVAAPAASPAPPPTLDLVPRVTSSQVFPVRTLQTSKPINHRKTPSHKRDALFRPSLIYLPLLSLINCIPSKWWKDLGIKSTASILPVGNFCFPSGKLGVGKESTEKVLCLEVGGVGE